ncbi:acyl-CoA dehydrogenase family protein [Bradyrhizobium jicamae]|uniref:acyl-CoA dehydrogenase family protein n=1 Tax=Bradyrhizobium jicamae TaxID=280332 RepID=UPI001BAA3843|nr:acyl-CoA dehydrogenase family protein [Bradyrhizobium jicamae]MBR0758062.1 acyl-CoA dehydrogenase family protein [Bradyrhizobium jicamae]
MNYVRVQHSLPTADDLRFQAERMIPDLRARAGDADRNGEFLPEAIRELRQAGFFRILQPARFGGYSLNPTALWNVTRQLGRGCGSTAFLVSLLTVHGWIAGMFEASAQEEVFENGGDTIVANLSAGVRRQVSAVIEGKGLVVSGVWDFASGIDFADWVITAIGVPTANGDLEERIALVPRKEFTVEAGSWTMVGARATGSKRVALRDAFIPDHRMIRWADVEAGTYPGLRCNEGPLYQRTGAGSLLVLCSAAPVIAIAGAVVDHFVETVNRRKREQWAVIELGRSTSEVNMAHALLLHDTNELYEAGLRGEDLSLPTQARHRADAAVMSRVALSASDRLVSALGGSVFGAGHPVERLFRDIHTVATHHRVQPEPACELYGRVLLDGDA